MDAHAARKPADPRAARVPASWCLFHREYFIVDASSSIPELVEHALVVGPAALDANPHFEKDPASEQALHVASRGTGHRFHAHAALADQHCAMARLVDVDGGVDTAKIARLLEGVDADAGRVRDFLTERPEDFFADVLGGQKTLVPIGDLVLRVARVARWQTCG